MRLYDRTPAAERILARIAVKDRGHKTPCWCWQGSKNASGYGQVSVFDESGRKTIRKAHRIVYEALVKPIPSGLQIDHLCRVKECVRPDHLEPVENRENTRRYWARRSEDLGGRCVRGHDQGRWRRMTSRGKFYCSLCDSIRHKKSYRKRASLASRGDTHVDQQ